MNKNNKPYLISEDKVGRKIYLIRGQKVMLDYDLAKMYCVSTKHLNQQVKRNSERFPFDFMFQLTKDEADSLRSQFVTLKQGGHLKYMPYAFTEQGVAMLSSVVRSKRAIQVNIEIMRAFVKLRRLLATHRHLARKLEELEKKYDYQFRVVFDAIRDLMDRHDTGHAKIGFAPSKKH